MYILSQIFGLGAITFLFISFQQNKRINLLLCKLSADVCWSVHYFLLSAFAGLFREIIFMNSEKHKWADNPLWLVGFLCMNIVLGISNYNSPIDSFPIVASVFVTISMWIKNINFTKLIVSIACMLFWIYNFSIGSFAGIVSETISIISIIIFFIRRQINDGKNSKK